MTKTNRGFSLLELLIVVAIILIIATIAIPSLLRSRQVANESAAVANIRTINTAEVTYLSSSAGAYGAVGDLVTAGLLDTRFSNATGSGVSGYSYGITVFPGTYSVDAAAISTNNGRWAYSSGPDGVVRYTTTTALAPTGQAGLPVQ